MCVNKFLNCVFLEESNTIIMPEQSFLLKNFRDTFFRYMAAHGGNINRFRIDLEEDVPTLLTFDVVDMTGNPSRSIMDTIAKEGRVLYEAI